MQSFQKEVKTLTELGLTFSEAKVYLTLAHLGSTSAKAISKMSNVSKPDVYRVLATLQEKGFIEKTISTPAVFMATPIEQTLSLLIQLKDKEHNELKEKAYQLLHNFRTIQTEQNFQQEQQFVLVPEKEESARRSREINASKKSIDMVKSSQRFPKGLFIYAEELEKALERGVRLRTIYPETDREMKIPRYVNHYFKLGTFDMRYILEPPRALISIFDGKEALISTSATAGLGEASALWTNNSSLVTIIQKYFEMLWRSAKQGYIKNNILPTTC